MEEEDDEIDVLGVESLLTKNESQISFCYDGDHQIGLQCESKWVLDSTPQACWYDNRSESQQQFGGHSALESCHNNCWTDKEKYLLEKGLELFGRSWSRLAQYIGTKNANQVKSHLRAEGTGWAGKSSASTSSFGVDSVDLNFSELIDDMDIPASVEEVIAVVSTAQPTVALPSSQRDIPAVHGSTTSRKLKIRQKKSYCSSTKRRLVTGKLEEISRMYNAEDIKDVLTGNKERDRILLPNGEQVIRIRHGSNLSEDSDVDIDVDSVKVENEFCFKDNYPCKIEQHNIEEEDIIDAGKSPQREEETLLNKSHIKKDESRTSVIDNIGKGVSVFKENMMEQKKKYCKRDTQIFKGSLVTPSGKVMTVIVDDLPCYSEDTVQERNDAVNQLLPSSQENIIDDYIVNEEEKVVFSKMNQKSDTSIRSTKIKDSSCETSGTEKDIDISSRGRPRRKKVLIKKIEGDYTTMHTDKGKVVIPYKSSKKNYSTPYNKTSSKRIKTVKLVNCKTHTFENEAPYRVEMEVSALVLVDIHSHLSPKSEVIGLLGGKYRPQDGGVLSILMAVPCRTILSSNVHCDMCPVSQLESSEAIANRGLSVVGWYHSHPDFHPSPSDTDIDTQNMLQSWFNETGKPFVGLIISPYFLTHNVSTYRCCHVVMEKNRLVPYKLDCKLSSVEESMVSLKKSIEAAYKTLQKSGDFKHRLVYRCVDSIRHHLRKASPKIDENKIFQAIYEIRDFLHSLSAGPGLR